MNPIHYPAKNQSYVPPDRTKKYHAVSVEEPVVIAEIGCVHAGSVDRAKELIRLAYLAGANVAKFQKRNPVESTPKSWHNRPHPNARFAYGDTYLEHRLNLELDIEHHAELKRYCEEMGISYATSVWDMTSAKEVADLNPVFVKVPSACNHHTEMLNFLYKKYKGEVHLSTGMMDWNERLNLLAWISQDIDRIQKTVIYHCTSAYPCPFDKLYLNTLKWWVDCSPTRIGYSNHGQGIATDVAAYALGARYFERHFVDDRTFPHTDASASLEPQGLQKLCRDLKAVHAAFTTKPDDLDDLEAEQRNKLRGN